MTKLCLCLATALALALVVLAWRPSLDLDAARAFYLGDGHFVGATRSGVIARYTAWAFPFLVYLAMLVAAIGGKTSLVPARWAPRGKSLTFLTLSLALGPGLLVHAFLKEVSHRPRPYRTTAFAGDETFRPFTRFDGTCRNNCAFPSGETATATWTLAPASLAPPAWRGAALAASIGFIAATGLLRMAFGAHFLSDVCGAALVTILVILAVRSATGSGDR